MDLMLANSPGPKRWTGTLLSDTFTDTDDTALSSHTPDTVPAGSSWSNVLATMEVKGNVAAPDTSTASMSVINTLYSDVTVTAVMRFSSGTPSVSVLCRAANSDQSGWLGTMNTPTNELAIYELTTGTVTQRAAAARTFSVDTNYTVVLNAAGGTITLTEGANNTSFTSGTTHLTNSYTGVRANSTASNLNNLTVTTP